MCEHNKTPFKYSSMKCKVLELKLGWIRNFENLDSSWFVVVMLQYVSGSAESEFESTFDEYPKVYDLIDDL